MTQARREVNIIALNEAAERLGLSLYELKGFAWGLGEQLNRIGNYYVISLDSFERICKALDDRPMPRRKPSHQGPRVKREALATA